MVHPIADPALVSRLAKMDCPRRIAWLRKQVRWYVRDLAARALLGLPTEFDAMATAMEATIGTGESGALTPDEIKSAFWTEWKLGLDMAEKVRDRCEAVAARYIQLYRRRDGIAAALEVDRRRWPPHCLFLSPDDLALIAARFERHPGRTAAS